VLGDLGGLFQMLLVVYIVLLFLWAHGEKMGYACSCKSFPEETK
jgi:hypothetical protein